MALRALIASFFALSAVAANATDHHQTHHHQAGPAHVTVAGDGNVGYSLIVNGAPYTIRGVGMGEPSHALFSALVESGGNTIRTWSTDGADEILALAQEYGVMVAMGVSMGQEIHGFDYNNPEAVARQFQEITAQITKYKDHPNVLMWVVGNELNLLFDDAGNVKLVNPKVYQALNDVVEFAHRVDPHHPVSTAMAGYIQEHIAHALPYLPNLDILSVQLYGDLVHLHNMIQADTSKLPIMLTEYGPMGHWEMPKTAWGREIEEPSGVKAAGMADRIERFIKNEPTGRLIGNFAFLWGHKQERTATWYSLFTEQGNVDARIDELTRFWIGRYPEQRAPLTKTMTINGQWAGDNINLEAGQTYTAKIDVTDPNGDPLSTSWILRREVDERSEGGASEDAPEAVELSIYSANFDTLVFRAPMEPGEYRLFATTVDPSNKIGTANTPLVVRGR